MVLIQQRYKIFLCTSLLFLCMLLPAQAQEMLRQNARGSQVATLQSTLRALHYKISEIDGIFDEETKQAVLKFQRDQGLKMTGIVDDKTWRALEKAQPNTLKKAPSKRESRTPFPSVQTPENTPFPGAGKEMSPIVATAKKYIGVPYRFGGVTPKGFDCSGYVQYIFQQHGIALPRSADEQFKLGKKVRATALRKGDLVFFSTYEKGASHCGIYVGDGEFIHVSSSKGVRIDQLKDPYWKPKYLGAKRLPK